MDVKRILSISKSFVIVAFLIAGFTETINAQSVMPVDLVKLARASQNFENVSPFNEGKRNVKNLPKEVKNYSILQMDKKMVSKILSNSNTAMTLSLPGSSKRSFQLELIEVRLPPFSLVEAPAMTPVKYQDGRHYRGIVKGQPKSLVSISVFKDEIMGFISEERAKGNWVLGKMNDKSGDHILYEDTDLMAKLGFKCDTDESGVTYSAHELNNQNAARALTDCIGMYFEVDYNIFVNKGSLANTTAYVTGLYNQVATLYANEQILTNISEIVVWTSTSPYSGPSSSDMLNQFTAYRNGFNGNIAMLLSYSSSGGIAYVNTLCNSNPDYRMGFSSIYSSYSSVPTYSWSVEVVTHEFGHLVGSSHTHACVWNGNSTAIDGCYTTEGGCSNPGLPSNGGTVMSYCHLTSAGINFNNGFGPQPGNLIRSKVTAATCLAACSESPPSCTDGIQNGQETGIDCGGPSCPPCGSGCTANPGTITIVLDNYPNETTWNLKTTAGTTLYSGGPYSVAGSTVNVPICLPNGCYIFTIYDAFGDGICCSYGNGSYTVVVNGSTVANGGAFASSAAHNFCANSTPATCSDGIQNQGETGIDCGGPNCPACPPTPTCNDGIQNQGETGVDCGGPNCPACPPLPTCSDGIQNQGETAVDCGGPNCPACSTCNDGIQNGNETGIDCGGSCGYPAVAITGPSNICIGTTTTLSPTTGGTWSSNNPTIATVNNSGLVTGVSAGATTFIFTKSNGCASNPTNAITVNPRPPVSITGNSTICAGATTTLSPTSGGTWTSNNVAIATVNNAGLVTGVNAGSATFVFTNSTTGCLSNPTNPVTINARPPVSITGSTSICISNTTTLSPTSGGTWASSNPTVATVTNSGLVTGISAGVSTFIFTSSATGCASDPTSQISVTNGQPASITGSSSICPATTTTLSPTSGGTWASSNPAVASVSNAGIVTGIIVGTATFTFTSSSGCVSNPTGIVTVNALPTVTITGVNTICAGATTTVSPTTGGTWASSNTSIATVTNAGVVTGVSGGTVTFYFTNSATGCTSNSTNPVTINARPPVTITGSASICIGSTTTLSPTSGGSWVSSSNSIATVNNAGLVSGISAGSATFTFTSSSTGCVSNPTNPVTVNPKPPVSITGVTTICPSSTTTLSPSTGGTWTSSNSSIATVANTGIVTGVAAGTANFTFTNSSTGCISNATGNITVNERPTVSITGNSTICASATTTLSPTSGGTWASSNTSIATVTNGGVVTGVSGGTVTFTYTKSSTGCTSIPTNPITINARPAVSITGTSSVCIGSTTTLSPSSGGTWVSSSNSKATVTNAGIVTGVSTGTATFTFTNTSTGCVSLPTNPVTIVPKPTASITGSTTTCIGNTTTLSPATGGTWSSSNGAVATVTNSGVVTGVSVGTATFIFTDSSSGCSSNPSNPVTITARPIATITGISAVCIGAITTLSPVTGGTWTSSNPAVATVTNAGVVTGINVGSASFIFTNSNGCSSIPTSPITVNTCSSLGAYYFESGWQGWIDGGTDCSRYNGSNSYEGTYSISIRDHTSSSKMTSPNFNVTAYTKLTVDFWFYSQSMESGEDFWLQYFNGTNWVTIGSWISGTHFANNTFSNKVVNILKTEYTFPTNASFRFVCDATSDDDVIFIDKVIISAFTGSNIIDIPPPSSNIESPHLIYTDKFMVYPNPTTDDINIDYTLENDSDQNASISLQILDLSGRTISTTKYFGREGRITESTENLKSGLYIIRLNDATGKVLYFDKVQVIKQ